MIDVAIVGGGASGIMAAIFAARCGASVAILEKKPRIGKKILATGNGRCNFTNVNACSKDYNSEFVGPALDMFSSKDAIDFFCELGLLSREEAEGRVYPLSGQATAVLDVLRMETDRLRVKVITEFDVTDIKKKDNFFAISGNGETIKAKKVIVSTGGMAAPKSGSDGSGYRLLKKLGHKTGAIVPALVQLKTAKSVGGVRAYGKVSLSDGRFEQGEIQFNNYGISGIPVFGLAKYVKQGDKVFVDLLPDYTQEEVVELLEKRPLQTMETYLIGIINKALGQLLLKECGISPLSRRSDTLTKAEIEKIAKMLKAWRFDVTGVMPWENAQVTSGGIVLEEVNSKTMESKLVKGLYITGELLDIDGPCGGYNLQWAWSSGALAGREAAGAEN